MLLVVGLLAGTAAAFAVTEELKLEKSPITLTKVDALFSRLCGCPKRVAHIEFHLTKPDRITVTIVQNGHVVRTLLSNAERRGVVTIEWNGVTDNDQVAADGVYRPQVHLANAQRTILLPNPITLDTRAPTVSLLKIAHAGRRVIVTYEVSEPAHGILYVNGVKRVYARFQRLQDELRWFGVVGGRPVPAGSYRLALGAEDLAGNKATPKPIGTVRVGK